MSATPSKPIEQEFPFPYQPWDIQTKFMQSLYKTLDNNHVGIYESPTGTVSVWSSNVLLQPYSCKTEPLYSSCSHCFYSDSE
ncbi:hypothetical protein BDEG_24943 [Batrachochytrium dendrobatidis JEL423]|uniref:Uncharacterized protein n=1 Tax=Batrachochytrium dendrobatidis (strain JEL423) TaxID=403673 RepID=A0A177WN94_BATDL|nr:hypothetical protein BDEG_24943 [Batrachochytrium dendrobatidis JEL423]